MSDTSRNIPVEPKFIDATGFGIGESARQGGSHPSENNAPSRNLGSKSVHARRGLVGLDRVHRNEHGETRLEVIVSDGQVPIPGEPFERIDSGDPRGASRAGLVFAKTGSRYACMRLSSSRTVASIES